MFRSRALNGLLVVGCLFLAGLVLRAWLPNAIRRSPQEGRSTWQPPETEIPGSERGQVVNPRTWRPATPQERRAALSSVRGQLLAFRADDYVRANAYQANARRMASADDLRSMITRMYPEYAHSKSVTFGAAQADPTGRHVDVAVAVTGQNDVRSRALYLMVREGTAYRVGGVTNIVSERPR